MMVGVGGHCWCLWSSRSRVGVREGGGVWIVLTEPLSPGRAPSLSSRPVYHPFCRRHATIASMTCGRTAPKHRLRRGRLCWAARVTLTADQSCDTSRVVRAGGR
ncbi:hypothetical protein RRG08_061070 [Elysia crispata]|uniref:Uncharacterized protein n=1 Tax=Elysia crispata TaxID=231223 RepID=A0AAE0YW59_9GAST|nr:hypothetical protein RRG08_061070 [Elysia crispata]